MSLEHMLQDEREAWCFLLEEAEREGEFSMSIQNVNRMQDEALRAYDLRPAEEAPAWAQVIAQCEIAQQLARIATQLEDGQVALLEGDDIVERLSRIGSIIQDKQV